VDTPLSDFWQSKITLKSIWGFVPQKRMETVTVIKHFNVPDYITSGIIPGSINDIRYPFGFKRMKKTFHNGIVPAITLSAHAADHAVLFQEVLVFTAGVLTSTIGVMD
jgi:hypothetical protein